MVGAGDLPFGDHSFDICLCILSLNFFDDVHATLGEIWRVLTEDGCFRFEPLPVTNGALLYFKAHKQGSAHV